MPTAPETPESAASLVESARAAAARWRALPRSGSYVAALAVTLVVMMLLPLLYFSLIAALGWVFWWHVSEPSRVRFDSGTFINAVGWVAAYLLPALILGILLIFLLKPLFKGWGGGADRYIIRRVEEPELYEFIEAMCKAMGAPTPKTIEVDGEVNASASLGGLLGLLFARGLILRIGMPLAAGMTVGQFSSVLAHELGHFRQGVGMRITAVVITMNQWFGRIVFERDWLDLALWQMRLADTLVIRVFGRTMLALIFLTRIFFKAAYFIVHGLCALTLRQMEHDADLHMARWSGSEVTASSDRRMFELAMCERHAHSLIRERRDKETLPNDIPALMGASLHRLSPADQQEVETLMTKEDSHLFDSHPPTAERLRRVKEAAEPGVFHSKSPAAALFRDFRLMCIRATHAYYEENFEIAPGKVELTGVDQTVSTLAQESIVHDAAAKYLGVEHLACRPVFLSMSELAKVEPTKKDVQRVRAGQKAAAKGPAAMSDAAKKLRQAEQMIEKCEQARQMYELGFQTIPKTVGLKESSRKGVSDAVDRARAEAAEARAVIDPVLEAQAARLASALRLLYADGIEERLKDVKQIRERAGKLVKAQAALRDVYPDVERSAIDAAALIVAGEATTDRAMNKVAVPIVLRLSQTLFDRLNAIQRAASFIQHPLEAGVTLGEKVVPHVPRVEDAEDVYVESRDLPDRFAREQKRILAEIIEIAKKVESVMGLGKTEEAAQPLASSSAQRS